MDKKYNSYDIHIFVDADACPVVSIVENIADK